MCSPLHPIDLCQWEKKTSKTLSETSKNQKKPRKLPNCMPDDPFYYKVQHSGNSGPLEPDQLLGKIGSHPFFIGNGQKPLFFYVFFLLPGRKPTVSAVFLIFLKNIK
jgi:hypothetical protein